jgi:recombination associated protein RdgC
MFRSLTIYQLTQSTSAVLKRLKKALKDNQFGECGKHFQRAHGFVPPLGGDTTDMIYETHGCVLFCLRTDEKAVPAKFVKQEVASVVKKRVEKGEDLSPVDERLIKEKVIEELLPGIPPEPTRTYAYIDKNQGMLFVDATEAGADAFMEVLTKALEGTPFKLLGVKDDPCDKFTGWLKDSETLGEVLELGDNCSLKQAQEGGTAVIQIQHDDLESDEMKSMLDAGKKCCRIGLVHDDVTFAVTAKLGIRRLTLGHEKKEDIEKEGGDIPTELAIISGVVRNILGELEQLLGGWPKQELLDLGDEQGEAA